jgi:TonB family protein
MSGKDAAMAGATFFGIRRPADADRRLGMALLASALLHALVMLTLSKYSIHGPVFTRPVYAPLRVRLEKLPESPEVTPMVMSQKKALLHQKPTAAPPSTPVVPAQIEPSLFQPGVSVSATLYLNPVAGRVNSPLLATGEFHRLSEVSETPEVVRMRIPKYPRPAQDQRVSGWVVVLMFVDEQGKVVEAATVESSESFGDYANDIAEQMRDSLFTPGKINGRAVKTMMFATVRFDSTGLSGANAAEPR